MPHFDANEDPARPADPGHGEWPDRTERQPPVNRRVARLAPIQRVACQRVSARNPRLARSSWRGRNPRRACPLGRRPRTVANSLLHCRRLWIVCHGRSPGSQS
jgi:hypothetical protein